MPHPNFVDTDSGDLELIAQTLACRDNQLDTIADVTNVDVWNRYIREAALLLEELFRRHLISAERALPHKCVECDREYASAARAHQCSMSDKARHDVDFGDDE